MKKNLEQKVEQGLDENRGMDQDFEKIRVEDLQSLKEKEALEES